MSTTLPACLQPLRCHPSDAVIINLLIERDPAPVSIDEIAGILWTTMGVPSVRQLLNGCGLRPGVEAFVRSADQVLLRHEAPWRIHRAADGRYYAKREAA